MVITSNLHDQRDLCDKKPQSPLNNPSKACRSGSQAATAGADGILHAKAFNAEMLPYMYLRASVLFHNKIAQLQLGISGGRVVVKRGLPTCRWMWKAAV